MIRLLWPTFRRAWPQLLVLHFIGILFHDFSTHLYNVIRAQNSENIPALGFTMAFGTAFEIFWSMLWSMVLIDSATAVQNGVPRQSFSLLAKRYLNPLLIEYTRSLAAIMFRIPFFIIPALIEYIRLLFVPYAVMLYPAYEQGKIDALRASRQLSQGRWTVLIIISLASAVFSFLLDDFGRTIESPWFWQNPGPAALSVILTLFINVFYGVFLFSLFRQISMMRGLPKEVSC